MKIGTLFTLSFAGLISAIVIAATSSAFSATGFYDVTLQREPPVLRADYQLQGNLNSSVGTAPPLTSLTGSGGATSFANDSVDGFNRQTLRFPFNSGVSVNNIGTIVPEGAFTLAIVFKLDDMSQRRRFFDISGGTSANGFFFLNGRFEPENTANLAMLNNAYTQVVIVRTGTGQVHYYRDGFLRFTDTDDGEPLPNGIRFFQDALNDPLQASPGNVARIRLWDAPLTQTEVNALDRVPEAPAGSMPVTFLSTRNGVTEQYRMNADGTSQVRLTNNQVNDISGRFSPDGTKLVYQRRQAVASDPQQIWIMNVDGTGQTRLTNTTANDISASWRPDGQKIIFSRCDANIVCDLYTMNSDGTDQQPITAANTALDEDQAKYTPNGQKLVFVCRDANSNYQICVSNSDGTNRQAITNTVSPIISQLVEVSPDGQKLVFVRNSTTIAGTAGDDIYTMNIDGSNVVNITNNATRDTTPMWSPDGTQIMFSASRAGGIPDIWIMNADGSNPVRLTRNSADDRLSDWFRGAAPRRAPFDFDGDGKTDISTYKPGPGEWWYLRSSDGGNRAFQFGNSTDVLVPADFTGDGKTDNAFYRNGGWFVLRSNDFSFYSFPFGTATDIPVPADYDGDGKADAAVFRPASGTWFIQRSSDGQVVVQSFGNSADRPAPADFDGDGKADLAIYRPLGSSGQSEWWYLRSSDGGNRAYAFGQSSDKTVVGDYTGDGRADFAFFRNGQWFVLRSSDLTFYSFPFGTATDIPAPGDYDGDGTTDAAVFRPSDTNWYVQRSTTGTLIQQFGAPNDRPVPSVYVR